MSSSAKGKWGRRWKGEVAELDSKIWGVSVWAFQAFCCGAMNYCQRKLVLIVFAALRVLLGVTSRQ